MEMAEPGIGAEHSMVQFIDQMVAGCVDSGYNTVKQIQEQEGTSQGSKAQWENPSDSKTFIQKDKTEVDSVETNMDKQGTEQCVEHSQVGSSLLVESMEESTCEEDSLVSTLPSVTGNMPCGQEESQDIVNQDSTSGSIASPPNSLKIQDTSDSDTKEGSEVKARGKDAGIFSEDCECGEKEFPHEVIVECVESSPTFDYEVFVTTSLTNGTESNEQGLTSPVRSPVTSVTDSADQDIGINPREQVPQQGGQEKGSEAVQEEQTQDLETEKNSAQDDPDSLHDLSNLTTSVINSFDSVIDSLDDTGCSDMVQDNADTENCEQGSSVAPEHGEECPKSPSNQIGETDSSRVPQSNSIISAEASAAGDSCNTEEKTDSSELPCPENEQARVGIPEAVEGHGGGIGHQAIDKSEETSPGSLEASKDTDSPTSTENSKDKDTSASTENRKDTDTSASTQNSKNTDNLETTEDSKDTDSPENTEDRKITDSLEEKKDIDISHENLMPGNSEDIVKAAGKFEELENASDTNMEDVRHQEESGSVDRDTTCATEAVQEESRSVMGEDGGGGVGEDTVMAEGGLDEDAMQVLDSLDAAIVSGAGELAGEGQEGSSEEKTEAGSSEEAPVAIDDESQTGSKEDIEGEPASQEVPAEEESPAAACLDDDETSPASSEEKSTHEDSKDVEENQETQALLDVEAEEKPDTPKDEMKAEDSGGSPQGGVHQEEDMNQAEDVEKTEGVSCDEKPSREEAGEETTGGESGAAGESEDSMKTVETISPPAGLTRIEETTDETSPGPASNGSVAQESAAGDQRPDMLSMYADAVLDNVDPYKAPDTEQAFMDSLKPKKKPSEDRSHLLRKKPAQQKLSQEEELEKKISFEEKMRAGTAKLLAASRNPQQLLEAAKNLLTSNTRMVGYMNQLQKSKAQDVLGQPCPTATEADKASKGKVSISGLRIPLMWKEHDYFKSKADSKRFAVFCMLRVGTQVHDTTLKQDVDRTQTDVSFEQTFVFADVAPNFELKVEVYVHRMSADDLPSHSTPQRLRRKFTEISHSVGRRLSGLKDDSDDTIVGPKFDCIAESTLLLADICGNLATYNLTLTPSSDAYNADLPLFGTLSCRLSARPDGLDKELLAGAVSLQEGEQGETKHYWAKLVDFELKCWNTHRDSQKGPPHLRLPISKNMWVEQDEGRVLVYTQHPRSRTVHALSGGSTGEWARALEQQVTDRRTWDHVIDLDLRVEAASQARPYQARSKLSLYQQTEVESPLTKILNKHESKTRSIRYEDI